MIFFLFAHSFTTVATTQSKNIEFRYITNWDKECYDALLNFLKTVYRDVSFNLKTMDFLSLVVFCDDMFANPEAAKPFVEQLMAFIAAQNQLDTSLIDTFMNRTKGKYSRDLVEKLMYRIFITHVWAPKELEKIYPAIKNPPEAVIEKTKEEINKQIKASLKHGSCILIQVDPMALADIEELKSIKDIEKLVEYAKGKFPVEYQQDIPLMLNHEGMQKALEESLHTSRPVFVQVEERVGFVVLAKQSPTEEPPYEMILQTARVQMAHKYIPNFVIQAKEHVKMRILGTQTS